MRTLLTAVVAALFGLSGAAMAQTGSTKRPPTPGQSEYAPGQQPGAAKNSAPGQQMKKKNDPASPGASEYAPGQQGKSGGTTSGSGTGTSTTKKK